MNWGLMIILTVISLLKGSGEGLSMVGITRCDGTDWALFVVLQVTCFIFLALGVYVVKNEHNLKVECGYEFTDGD